MTAPPLLLAAHGTSDQAGVDAFAALARRVGQLAAADGTRVAGGFIELSEPPLREAADATTLLVGGIAADRINQRSIIIVVEAVNLIAVSTCRPRKLACQ